MVIKVQDLYYLCKQQVEKGNGGKKILISADDEGNSYHQLLFAFAEDLQEYKDFIYCVGEEELKNYIILG